MSCTCATSCARSVEALAKSDCRPRSRPWNLPFEKPGGRQRGGDDSVAVRRQLDTSGCRGGWGGMPHRSAVVGGVQRDEGRSQGGISFGVEGPLAKFARLPTGRGCMPVTFSMDTENDGYLDGRSATQFVTEADWIPGFWNYLLDLDRDDLIAELIQNDLDQDATRTVICFESDHLVCEGNGRPVESEGWQRLRKIQGAGDSVRAKSGKIGVKNHGLKTAFTIGDEIRLMSDGQAVIQTLYAKGRRKPPYPGASPSPLPDPEAPAVGCRIIIRYRDRTIEPPQGEASVFGAVTAQEIDALFRSACASAPEQFAGIVSPDVAPRYEIILRHWRLGEARFQFSCTRPRKIPGGIELFRRRCTVSGTVRPLPNAIQEQAARRLTPLKRSLRKRVADFFRRGNRFFVEVSLGRSTGMANPAPALDDSAIRSATRRIPMRRARGTARISMRQSPRIASGTAPPATRRRTRTCAPPAKRY